MTAYKHVHQYERIDDFWCCVRPNCSHYIPRNVRGGSAEGRRSICPECGEAYDLTIPLMRKDRPICYSCATSHRKADLQASLTPGVNVDELEAALNEGPEAVSRLIARLGLDKEDTESDINPKP